MDDIDSVLDYAHGLAWKVDYLTDEPIVIFRSCIQNFQKKLNVFVGNWIISGN